MDLKGRFLLQVLVFVLAAGLAASTAFISDAALQAQRSTGRNLLQTRKSCSVNFEFMNYTIITSKCKGPLYPAKLCCDALKDFACPYADEINDVTNECASTMFSYINLYGKYPPGLFASECKEDKIGLVCPAESPKAAQDADASGAYVTRMIFPQIGLVSALVLGFLFS
ncbi:uncharacterized protein A4U43_C08F34450 [Asparagus officinalis]|uniref:GPI-anchored protein LLG1-like n=1 Tax=Asparagus officinalis TaxID=4686 RepID=UPI00098DF60F|nr:GPI-anchored protein LLG1-like [Asparagus officinalis]ONK61872.1 uncharacterized protein A4U43_C08F34450 [Asparagus officinalis]